MPTMDRRIKGCRNVHCRYNKERKHLPLDYNYCPICGEKVGLVCRECFAEIEDLGKTHFRCDACEAKKAKRAEEQREAGEGGEKDCGTGSGCGGECHENCCGPSCISFHLKAAELARALIRAAFRELVESDAGTLRKEVPASLSPRPPGRLG